MNTVATPQPLADVQRDDWLIKDTLVIGKARRIPYRCTYRTPKLVWIGNRRYTLNGQPKGTWEYGSIRLPKPGEVEELQEAKRQSRRASEQSGRDHANERERYISLIYQAALSHDRELFVELLGPWEVGNWDDKLAKLDEIAATTKG